jgi:hypothetical protein
MTQPREKSAATVAKQTGAKKAGTKSAGAKTSGGSKKSGGSSKKGTGNQSKGTVGQGADVSNLGPARGNAQKLEKGARFGDPIEPGKLSDAPKQDQALARSIGNKEANKLV